ncbi:MAG: fibrillarin-like rRNA/tRNA 2'-O-methyltransferase [Candidatus Aenigmatarchaeota archaeon]|nr:MAG: fibrillarin-like rRNA/tRNA 2'-O-methyltransferase [Candidatus Aenigmarchaeota archaeon]
MKEISAGIWKDGKRLFTKSMVRGYHDYTKNVFKKGKTEYREWDPNKSKPAAAIMKGLKEFPLRKDDKVLYLGAASGATCSFFSDIIGENGVIYAVEISERSARDLNVTAEKRGNIVPILADARKPEAYEWVEPVDVVFEDVASDEQGPIMIRNADTFLKPAGHAMIAIKARSIDVVKDPKQVYREQLSLLEKHFEILQKVTLDPYEKDHLFALMQLKK